MILKDYSFYSFIFNQSSIIQLIKNLNMNEELHIKRQKYKGSVLTIQQLIAQAGNSQWYQLRMFFIFFLVFFFSSFIQMGFPVIFSQAKFECPSAQTCSQQLACLNNYPLIQYPNSVAYTYNLTCIRKKLLQICFKVFLSGGFIGSLYFGIVLQKKGRRYALLESITIMIFGLFLSLASESLFIFNVGVFFFNGGFSGFYNASLLSLTEIMNEESRTLTPMMLLIGWAIGQIIMGSISIWLSNWKFIFLIVAVSLTLLLYLSSKFVLQSPRYYIVIEQFDLAKQTVVKIASINGRNLDIFYLKQQTDFQERKKKSFQYLSTQTKYQHYSYKSLFCISQQLRTEVLIVGYLCFIIGLSYFTSVHSLINPDISINQNIILGGVVQLVTYIIGMIISMNYCRIYVIKRLIIISGFVHVIFFFIDPIRKYQGFGKFILINQNILVRVLMSIGNSLMLIYAIQLFPTSIRHLAFGIFGFIIKLAYLSSGSLRIFCSTRHIHPNFIIAILFYIGYFFVTKLSQTKNHEFKDQISDKYKQQNIQLNN